MTGTISDFEENGQSLGSWKVDLAADYATIDTADMRTEMFNATMGKTITHRHTDGTA